MSTRTEAKPFLKWAGGKTQLLPVIHRHLPTQLKEREFVYVEPFIGGGAMLFAMLSSYPTLKKAIINDINGDLINCYQVVATEAERLIELLRDLEAQYHQLAAEPEERSNFYYERRALFNTRQSSTVEQAALLIFLNRTCFNGLYRVNRNNQFNVPIGNYKRPTICDAATILAASRALEKVEILCGDYEKTLEHIPARTPAFFYIDPPYKPLSSTSNFNSYAKGDFDDAEQVRLRDFCVKLDSQQHQWLLSNSDVKAVNPKDDLLDRIYADFTIRRVIANRRINAKASQRGPLTELLICNYD